MAEEQAPKVSGIWGYLSIIGPGIAIAATGVGAGDMVATAVSGSRFGYAIAWAAIVGAVLKYILNEGLARWQLATGMTLIEGWVRHLGKWAQAFFLIYLLIWSLSVGAGLIVACGLAAHSITGLFSVQTWGVIHSLLGVALVLAGKYDQFELMMKICVGSMFAALLGCALWVTPPLKSLQHIIMDASIPLDSTTLVLGVIGGVGGSLTLLAYGYWIKEKNWRGAGWMKLVRLDLGVAYVLTGLFGLAVVVISAAVLKPKGLVIQGNKSIIVMAEQLGLVIGAAGQWVFLFGFWGAVMSSLLGVWQGVPYMFCDFVGLVRNVPEQERAEMVKPTSIWYRGYLLWLALPPLFFVYLSKPVFLIVLYSAIGALFMPFIAGTLLYMNNNKKWVGELRNDWLTNVLLVLSLLLFVYLGVQKITKRVIGPKKAKAAAVYQLPSRPTPATSADKEVVKGRNHKGVGDLPTLDQRLHARERQQLCLNHLTRVEVGLSIR